MDVVVANAYASWEQSRRNGLPRILTWITFRVLRTYRIPTVLPSGSRSETRKERRSTAHHGAVPTILSWIKLARTVASLGRGCVGA